MKVRAYTRRHGGVPQPDQSRGYRKVGWAFQSPERRANPVWHSTGPKGRGGGGAMDRGQLKFNATRD